MRAIIVLITMTLIWVLTPAYSEAKDRDRADRHYDRDREHYVYRVDRDHDRRHDGRYDKFRDGRHRHGPYRVERDRHVVYRPYPQQIVYRPVPTRVVYRQPVVYYPASYFTIGGPHLSFRITW